jgi:hypothetical protein
VPRPARACLSMRSVLSYYSVQKVNSDRELADSTKRVAPGVSSSVV